jgi:hypothetical protein
MNKYNSHDVEYVKKSLTINNTYARKYIYVLKESDRRNILKELQYFKDIYQLPDNILVQCLINKYVKIRLYNIKFADINKDVNDHYKFLLIIRECYDNNIDTI